MTQNTNIDREVVVQGNWIIFGLLGLCLMLEGDACENYWIGLCGVAGVTFGFIGNLIANYVFEKGFSRGEVAFGLGIFALSVLIFIALAISSALTDVGFLIGLTMLMVSISGLIIYLLTRHGVRGIFSQFGVVTSGHSRASK